MPNFEDLLNTPLNDDAFREPPPWPVGNYLFMIDGPYKVEERGQNKTKFVVWDAKALQAQEDVDQDTLAEMGGIAGKKLQLSFAATDQSVFIIQRFLTDTLGISDRLPLQQALAEAQGRQFIGTVRHRSYKPNNSDEMRIRAEIGGTARAD